MGCGSWRSMVLCVCVCACVSLWGEVKEMVKTKRSKNKMCWALPKHCNSNSGNCEGQYISLRDQVFALWS